MGSFSRRTLVKGAAIIGAGALLPRPSSAAVVKQKGILDGNSDPSHDADVIVSAMLLGYAFRRLHDGHDCRFDVEVPEAAVREEVVTQKLKDKGLPESKRDEVRDEEIRAEVKGVQLLGRMVLKMNKLITPVGGKSVAIGAAPFYEFDAEANPKGRRMIIGKSGNLPSTDTHRYDPVLADAGTVADKLYELTHGPHRATLGYQGRGAYTGLVIGREGPDPKMPPPVQLLSTLRHNVPSADAFGRRWHPTAKVGDGAEVGADAKHRTWGMIGNNELQAALKSQGMPFDGESPHPGTDIIAYTHGMIRAIYDVEYYKRAVPGKKPGIPHEIAVGQYTYKLSSCFPCSTFMEASGYPASSTHVGRGESWSPLFQQVPPGKDPWNPAQLTGETAKNISEVNKKWYKYCHTVLQQGNTMLLGGVARKLVSDAHLASVTALNHYLTDHMKDDLPAHIACTNLFLDALTVHSGDAERLDRVIKA